MYLNAALLIRSASGKVHIPPLSLAAVGKAVAQTVLAFVMTNY